MIFHQFYSDFYFLNNCADNEIENNNAVDNIVIDRIFNFTLY